MGATVLKGDSSSHGNTVLEGSSRTVVGGIPLSYVGAGVSGDPHRHGPNSIVSSGNSGRTIVAGKVAASSGAGTGCGASIGGSGSRTVIGG